MSGLLAGYGIDMAEVEAASFDVKDDTWEFVVGDMFILEGTTNHPDKTWIVIEFQLGDEGKTKSEWFQLPMDSDNKTPLEEQKLGYLKQRLVSLGVPDECLADFGPEDVVGKRGTLQTFTKNGYQNIKNVFLVEQEDEPVAAPVPVKRKPAAKAVAAPVAEEQTEEDTDEPEAPAKAAVPAKAAAAGVRKNPFAPK